MLITRGEDGSFLVSGLMKVLRSKAVSVDVAEVGGGGRKRFVQAREREGSSQEQGEK